LPRGFCLSGYEVCLSRFDAIKTNLGAALRELWHSDGVSPGFSLAFQFVQCDNSHLQIKRQTGYGPAQESLRLWL